MKKNAEVSPLVEAAILAFKEKYPNVHPGNVGPANLDFEEIVKTFGYPTTYLDGIGWVPNFKDPRIIKLRKQLGFKVTE